MDKELKSPASLTVLLIALLVPGIGASADYEKLAEEFVALGMPDVANGEYVRGNFGADEAIELDPDDPNALRGNMWIVLRRTNQTMRVVRWQRLVDEEAITPEAKHQAGRIVSKQLAKHEEPDPEQMRHSNLPSYTFKSVDIKLDLRSAIAQVEKRMKANGGHYIDQQICDLFLFGLQAVRSGIMTEGSALLRTIGHYAGDEQAVIDCHKDKLANYRYFEIFRKFSRTGDWNNYVTELEAVRKDFDGVWSAGPFAERLIVRIKAQLARPEPPPISGRWLTDEDHALAIELATSTSLPSDSRLMPGGMSGSSYWPISSHGLDTFDSDVLLRIKQRNRLSIPLLLAMAKDDHLIATKCRVDGSSMFDLDCKKPSFRPNVIAGNMPYTRGEVAIALLRAFVPSDPFERIGDDAIIDAARKWYLKHRDKTDTELLVHYLDSDHTQGREVAYQTLLNSTNGEHRKLAFRWLERQPISEDSIYRVGRLDFGKDTVVQEFVRKFVVKAEGVIKKGNHNSKKGLLHTLDEMREASSGKTIEDYLLEFRAGIKPPRDVLSNIRRVTARLPTEAQTDLFLSLAYETTETRLALEIIDMIPRHTSTNTVSKQWSKLLRQQRTIPFFAPEQFVYSQSLAGRFIAPTFAHEIAFRMERTQPDWTIWQRADEAVLQLGKPAADLVLARAGARIAGKNPPALPSTDNVPAPRLRELKHALATLPVAKIEEFVDSLSLSEHMALAGIKNLTVRPDITQRANRLTTIRCQLGSPAIRSHVESQRGQPIDLEFVERLVDLCRRFVRDGNSGCINLIRSRPFGGIALETSSPQFSSKQTYTRFDDRRKLIHGEAIGRGPVGEINAGSFIVIGKTGRTAGTGRREGTETEETEILLKAIERMLDSRSNPAAPMHIRLLFIDGATFK